MQLSKWDWSSRLFQSQAASVGVVGLANFLLFIAILTPAWQVAEDLDVGRYVQSGLWLYCPGASQCWYIFSDDLINYYEKVDVCRFFLIGDCRKKLLRTPYFFGWHYAVLVLCLISLACGSIAIISAVAGWMAERRLRVTTVVYDVFVFLAWLLLCVALAVFMINAEMLESKYLIGVKNTFEKSYGYSVYLASFALLLLTFALLVGVILTTFVFFTGPRAADQEYYEHEQQAERERMQRMQMMQHYYAGSKTETLPRVDQLQGPHTRSISPSSQQLHQSASGQLSPGAHGLFIPPERGDGGTFTPTTRHYFSY